MATQSISMPGNTRPQGESPHGKPLDLLPIYTEDVLNADKDLHAASHGTSSVPASNRRKHKDGEEPSPQQHPVFSDVLTASLTLTGAQHTKKAADDNAQGYKNTSARSVSLSGISDRESYASLTSEFAAISADHGSRHNTHADTLQEASRADAISAGQIAQQTKAATVQGNKPDMLATTSPNISKPDIPAIMSPNISKPDIPAAIVPNISKPDTMATMSPNISKSDILAATVPNASKPDTMATMSPNISKFDMAAATVPNASKPDTMATIHTGRQQSSLLMANSSIHQSLSTKIGGNLQPVMAEVAASQATDSIKADAAKIQNNHQVKDLHPVASPASGPVTVSHAISKAEQSLNIPLNASLETVAQQITVQSTILQAGQMTELRLRLHPPELGDITITIQKNHAGVLSAHLMAATGAGHDLISANLNQLRDALAQQTGSGSAHVSVSQQQTSGQGGGNRHLSHQSPHADSADGGNSPPAKINGARDSPSLPSQRSTASLIDYIV